MQELKNDLFGQILIADWKTVWSVTSDVWAHMLDLIYTGHPEEAEHFLDRVWTGDENTKQWFVYDFKRRLISSQYADQLPIDLFGYGSVASDRMTDYLATMQQIMGETDGKK